MIHHLMVGTWLRPGAIFTFVFDDEVGSLQLLKRTVIDHDEPISWMTFSHDRKTIYGASMKSWTSYTVDSPDSIIRSASKPLAGHPSAANRESNTRAIFVLAARKAPYAVYGNPFYNYAEFGNIFSTTSDGALAQNVQNYAYDENSGVHGMVFDPDENYLYSADLSANKIWTHRKASDGTLHKEHSQDAPEDNDHPRWVEMAPTGKFLYALMEAGNWLVEYAIDEKSRIPRPTGQRFSLIPEVERANNLKNYRGDVVVRNRSGTYLFATTRSNTLQVPGYITAYRLHETGKIDKQISMTETNSSGGHSNAISPCPWTDRWLALTDDTVGFIEIWKWENEKLSCSDRLRCEVREPGFGMNAIWYD